MKRNRLHAVIAASLLATGVLQTTAFAQAQTQPQTTAFTYQGQLNASGAYPSGNYLFTFTLYDASTNGTPIGSAISENVQVINGLFTVDLDFQEVFGPTQYWLEISVNGQVLENRQRINSVPVADYALNGNPGPTGPAGATGATGPTGADSTVVGPAGATGSTGATGADSTVAGPPGPIGPAGALGAIGPQGSAGPKGDTGSAGSEGPPGAAGPQGPTGPQGAVGSQGPAGPQGSAGATGAAGASSVVKDANGNPLGALISFFGSGVTVSSQGYIINLGLDGLFLTSQIWWTASGSCTGTAYLNDGFGGSGGQPIYYRSVQYSGAANSLLVPSGTAVKDIVTSVGAGSSNHSIENSGAANGSSDCSTNQGANGFGGWPLKTFDAAATLGWSLSNTCTSELNGGTSNNRLCVAGPLQLP